MTEPLAALFRFGAYWLVCRPDFSARHAWLIARALSAAAPEFAGAPAPPADPEPPPEPPSEHAHP